MDFDSTIFRCAPRGPRLTSAGCAATCNSSAATCRKHVQLLAVVKDEAYGHGALDVARIALEEGAWGFGLSTLEEAMVLRDAGITAPLLLLGERQEAELRGAWRTT